MQLGYTSRKAMHGTAATAGPTSFSDDLGQQAQKQQPGGPGSFPGLDLSYNSTLTFQSPLSKLLHGAKCERTQVP